MVSFVLVIRPSVFNDVKKEDEYLGVDEMVEVISGNSSIPVVICISKSLLTKHFPFK